MKALEKDRNRRYETANGLAPRRAALPGRRAGAGVPAVGAVSLPQVRAAEQGAAGGDGLVLLVLVAGIIGTTLALVMEARAQSKQARQGESQALQSEAEARAVLQFFEKHVLSAARPKGQGQGLGRQATIRDAVDRAEPDIGQTAFAEQPLAEASIRRCWDLRIGMRAIIARPSCSTSGPGSTRGPPGGNHPDTLNSMTSLGQAYQSAGRLTDALTLHEATLKLRIARLGPDDSETLWTMNRLADTLLALGRAAEALPLYEEELSGAWATLGPDHKDTLIYMDKLAGGYRSVGRLTEAVQLLEETLKRYQATLARPPRQASTP